MTNEDRVRLIYNGRVLGRDQTLAELGLTDNCVVHCLVQRSVQANTNESGPTSPNDNLQHNNRLMFYRLQMLQSMMVIGSITRYMARVLHRMQMVESMMVTGSMTR